MNFSKTMDFYMKKSNISNYQMAKDTGISDSLIGYWRNGRRKPTLENLVVIANYLNISIDTLVRGDPSENNSILLDNNHSSSEESTDTLQKEIINRIDSLIKKSGMNANEFAKKIGKRPGIVTDWRTGRSFPSIEVLCNICNILNCSFYDIIPESDYVFSSSLDIKKGRSEDILIKYYRGMGTSDQEELLLIAEIKYRKEHKNTKLLSSQEENKMA